MSSRIREDLTEMKKKLGEYVDKGRVVGHHEFRKEPVIAEKPDRSKIKPLRKVEKCDAHFMAVDCSTRTLKRANNWGVYLLRTAYASVRDRDVNWGYEERMRTVVGDAYIRFRVLEDARRELESEMVLNILGAEDILGKVSEDDYYFLLDGASHFGGYKKFRVSLYDECEKRGIKLLTISKQSPTLHDERGRDFLPRISMLSPHPIWTYYPIKTANKHEDLYGDVSVVKLCADSPRLFRCDIMEYLLREGGEVHEVLSPLTSLSEDPRCLGYPITLWLAHDFSAPSDSKLLHYHDQVEKTLADAGLLDVLRVEELSCNFPDELHGIKHPFEWEWIERV
jgi:hypothetical protein